MPSSPEREVWIVEQIRQTEAELASTLASIQEAHLAGRPTAKDQQRAQHLSGLLSSLHEELAALQMGADTTRQRRTTDAAKAAVDRDSAQPTNWKPWAVAAVLIAGVVGVVTYAVGGTNES